MTEIDDKHAELGGDAGWFGPALAPEEDALDGGRKRQYTGGWIYWSHRTGAHEVHGDIFQRWQELGSESAEAGLGYPLTDEMPAARLGRFNHFEKGSIYWTSQLGANEVSRPIRNYWAEMGWERGLLGFPVTRPFTVGLDRSGAYTVQEFEGGWVDSPEAFDAVRMIRKPGLVLPNWSMMVRFVQVSDDNGGRICPLDGIASYLREANEVFAAAGIRLWSDGNILSLRSTDVAETTGADQPSWASVRAICNGYAQREPSIMVFLRSGFPGMGGYSWWDYDFIVMPPFHDMKEFGAHGGWLFAHEMGHYLGLPHTCGPEFRTREEAENRILGGLDPASFDNDRGIVADTPADPHILEFMGQPTVRSVRLGSQGYALARDNVMSYWDRAFKDERGYTARLTADQIRRVRKVLEDRANRHLKLAGLDNDRSCEELEFGIRLGNARLQSLWLAGVVGADRTAHEFRVHMALHDLEELQLQSARQRCVTS